MTTDTATAVPEDILAPETRPPQRGRRIALWILAAFVVLLLAAIAIPFLFRDRIVARLTREIDQVVDAHVDWRDVSLSVLRDFPNVTLRVQAPTIVGVTPFAGDTLLSMREAKLVLDIGSVLRHLRRAEPIVVREIALERPDVRLRVLPDGLANWNIVKSRGRDTSAAARPLSVTLRELRITDGMISLNDAKSKLVASVVGLQERMEGDFATERFVLSTRTRADSVSLRFAGIPYLTRVAVELNADVDADLRQNRFTFTDDTLRLNALLLAFGGRVTAGKPNVGLDLTLASPRTDFRDILSLVPTVFTREFDQIRTTGTMSLTGRVQGEFGPAAFPAFAVRARVENGTFKYPSLPLPARDIQLQLALDNRGGSSDSTVVAIERLRATIGSRPIEARLVMRTPISDPDVDLTLRGGLDLADIGRTVKLEQVRELAGIANADLSMRARLSDVDAKRYDRVTANGTLHLADLALRSSALPHAVAVDTAALRFTPRAAELTTLSARIGKSDLRASVALDNLLGFVLRNDELRGSGTVHSEHLDLFELRPKERTSGVIPVPPHVDFTLQASANRVSYGALALSEVRGRVRIKDQKVTLDSLRTQTLGGALVANGYYETTNVARPTFDAALRLAGIDVPTAFKSLVTVQRLAPVARWAQGQISGVVGLRGALDTNMVPLFAGLSGQGEVDADRLSLKDAPLFEKLADAVKLEALRKPALAAVRVSYALANGRVDLKPFAIGVGGIQMAVAGTHGIDQSLDYELSLAVPRAMLVGATGNVVTSLASRAGKKATDLLQGEAVKLTADVTGTATDPRLSLNFAGMAASARQAAESVVRAEVAERTAALKARADSVADEHRRRARAEADRLVSEAEQQAARLREEAQSRATALEQAANARIDSLVARATNPIARKAAELAAGRIRKETGEQTQRLVREADTRANALVAGARQRADSLLARPDSSGVTPPAANP